MAHSVQIRPKQNESSVQATMKRLAAMTPKPLFHKGLWWKETVGVGFEPTVTQGATPVFKTGAFNRSATPPGELGRELKCRAGARCCQCLRLASVSVTRCPREISAWRERLARRDSTQVLRRRRWRDRAAARHEVGRDGFGHERQQPEQQEQGPVRAAAGLRARLIVGQ